MHADRQVLQVLTLLNGMHCRIYLYVISRKFEARKSEHARRVVKPFKVRAQTAGWNMHVAANMRLEVDFHTRILYITWRSSICRACWRCRSRARAPDTVGAPDFQPTSLPPLPFTSV